jgi:hypothetical protein
MIVERLIKEFTTRLPEYAVIIIGKIQAFIIQYVQEKIAEILDKLQRECPPPATLERLSNTVKNVRKTLNSINKKIDTVEKISKYLDPVILAVTIFIEVQKLLPIPTIAAGTQNRNSSRLRKFEKLLEGLYDTRFAIKASVTAAKAFMVPIQSALNVIEALIERCATQGDISEEERKDILDRIQNKTEEIYRIGIQYKSEKGTIYTIKIIEDPNSPDIAPRRQAIAQDFRGITVLTGPSSFAGDPQILVEELKFRIENQLP